MRLLHHEKQLCYAKFTAKNMAAILCSESEFNTRNYVYL